MLELELPLNPAPLAYSAGNSKRLQLQDSGAGAVPVPVPEISTLFDSRLDTLRPVDTLTWRDLRKRPMLPRSVARFAAFL
jgi:hypothetical protein